MLFTQIALLAIFAAVLGMVLDKLRQPTILGYLLAGVIAAYWGVVQGEAEVVHTLEDLGMIGVVLLLFLVGMELSAPRVKSVGKAAFFVGMGQILFTVGVGWLLIMVLGFDWLTSIYMSIALAFSSTIVIVKLLTEMGDLQSLHGRIAVGFLLVQDLAAILMLVVLSAVGGGSFSFWVLLMTLIKAVVLVAVVWWLSVYAMPKMIDYLSPSVELLFLSSVAWGLGFSAFMIWEPIGFSPEAGGFLAGITLANTRQHYEIFSRLRPLRDFFVMLFFVVLAINLVSIPFDFSLWVVAILSLFVLIGNPLIVMIIMKVLGYRARTGFMVSLTVAQISEFSLIVVSLGLTLGHLDDSILGIVTLVAVMTMTVSTYLMTGSHWLWNRFHVYLGWFEPKKANALMSGKEKIWKDHIVLIGCHRTGKAVLKHLLRQDRDVLVMDHDPEVASEVSSKDVAVYFGDLEDVDIYESVGLGEARMIVSTVTHYEGTLTLLEYIKNHNSKRSLLTLVTASSLDEAKEFYERGADYVSVPRFVTGLHLGQMVHRSLRNNDKAVIRDRARVEFDRLESYLQYA